MKNIETIMDETAFDSGYINWDSLAEQLRRSTSETDFCHSELKSFISKVSKAYSREAESYYERGSVMCFECESELISGYCGKDR